MAFALAAFLLVGGFWAGGGQGSGSEQQESGLARRRGPANSLPGRGFRRSRVHAGGITCRPWNGMGRQGAGSGRRCSMRRSLCLALFSLSGCLFAASWAIRDVQGATCAASRPAERPSLYISRPGSSDPVFLGRPACSDIAVSSGSVLPLGDGVYGSRLVVPFQTPSPSLLPTPTQPSVPPQRTAPTRLLCRPLLTPALLCRQGHLRPDQLPDPRGSLSQRPRSSRWGNRTLPCRRAPPQTFPDLVRN
jgi:hypothetical protein